MNTVDAEACGAGAHTYIMLYYTHTVYIYYAYINVKSAFIRTTKSTL
jgi:hypothetical protein